MLLTNVVHKRCLLALAKQFEDAAATTLNLDLSHKVWTLK